MSGASITVVVPVRDRADLLATTLAAVAAQAPRPEILVADDGSADGSGAVAQAFGATVLRNDRTQWGAAAARNAALARVETELVAYVDSDDILCPGALARLSEALGAAPAASFAFGCGLVAREEPSGWTPGGLVAPTRRELASPLPALFARNFVPASGCLVRTEAARAAGGHDVGRRFSEDHDFWLKLAREQPPAHAPELVVVYRSHPGNRHRQAQAREDDAAITELAMADPRLRAARPERIGTQLCEQGVEAIHARDPALLARTLRTLVWEEDRPARVVRGAVRHLRLRRRSGAAGRRIWAERADLRDWLESVRASGAHVAAPLRRP